MTLRLSQETIDNLEQYRIEWLNYSETIQEEEETEYIYKKLSELIEAGNPFVEYEVKEGAIVIVAKFVSDDTVRDITMGISFFELPKLRRFERLFDSLKEACEGLSLVSTSAKQSLGLGWFNHKKHEEMFPDSESCDNPGYGNHKAWETRTNWTVNEVAEELYRNYEGDMRSAQNLKLAINSQGEVVIDVDVQTSRINYGLHPQAYGQYKVYIEVDGDAKTIPANCEEYGWFEVEITQCYLKENPKFNDEIDDINNHSIIKMIELMEMNGHPQSRISDEAYHHLRQLVDKKLEGIKIQDPVFDVVYYVIDVLEEVDTRIVTAIRNLIK